MLVRTMSKVLALAAVAAACAMPCSAAPAVNGGEWEITATSEMTGLPMQVPPQTMTYSACITPDKPVPTEPEQEGECKVTGVKAEGPAVSWTIECAGPQGNMKGTGKVVYQGDTMTGDQNMSISAPDGMKLQVKMRMTGKRIGPCLEKAPAKPDKL